jgi:plasmid stabilization system protein ParE
VPVRRVRLEPNAEAEARAAFVRYAARSVDAAARFQVAVEEGMDSLSESAERYPEIVPGVR